MRLRPMNLLATRSFAAPAIFAALLVPLMFSSASSAALECPQASKLPSDSVEAQVEALIPKGEALAQPEEMLSAVTLLREHGMSTDNAVNHLIASYCNTVAAESNVAQAAQADRVRKFAKDVTRIALQESGYESIIVDVALSPEIAEKAQDLAAQSGQTVGQWIAKLVSDGVE